MIIGISGLIGSGKGAVSDILVNDYKYAKMSFADTLKDATASIFGWQRSLLEGDTEESREFRETVDLYWTGRLSKPITPRYMLQYMGTEVMRNSLSSEIWIDSLRRKIENSNHKNIVIPDVRFPNEFEFVRSMEGCNFRVKRGKDPEWYMTAFMEKSLNGSSEKYNMSRDYPEVHYSEWASAGEAVNSIITNNGSLEDLKITMKAIMSWLE